MWLSKAAKSRATILHATNSAPLPELETFPDRMDFVRMVRQGLPRLGKTGARFLRLRVEARSQRAARGARPHGAADKFFRRGRL